MEKEGTAAQPQKKSLVSRKAWGVIAILSALIAISLRPGTDIATMALVGPMTKVRLARGLIAAAPRTRFLKNSAISARLKPCPCYKPRGKCGSFVGRRGNLLWMTGEFWGSASVAGYSENAFSPVRKSQKAAADPSAAPQDDKRFGGSGCVTGYGEVGIFEVKIREREG